jgi:hypothetical protein
VKPPTHIRLSRPDLHRPRTRRGVAVLVAAVIAGIAVLSVAGFVLAGATVSLYERYGFRPEAQSAAWANLTPQYSIGAPTCASCHAPEYDEWNASRHTGVQCETCHGPLGTHATTTPPAPARAVDATGEICTVCHEKALGRPETQPQVDLATHYGGFPCFQCHTVHSTVVSKPPLIPHSLTRLPACTTCHAPDALKPVPGGHVQAEDSVCRTCHVPRSGSDATPTEQPEVTP